MGGIDLVNDALNNTEFRLQESAAFVLGSAVSRYDSKMLSGSVITVMNYC